MYKGYWIIVISSLIKAQFPENYIWLKSKDSLGKNLSDEISKVENDKIENAQIVWPVLREI